LIARDAPLRLARKARLRRDPRSGRSILLYPERGLELSETAAHIARLCLDGGRTAEAIIAEVAAPHAAEMRSRIDAEVMAFLGSLEERGLLIQGEL
jgi:coenzyme PQQ biosynthesis protein PqqD